MVVWQPRPQGLMVDTRPHRDTINAASDRLYEAIRGQSSRDQQSDDLLWSHCRAGKIAEVAYALATGHDPASVIQDSKGSPDFPNVDVKGCERGRANLSIRADALHRHPEWIVVGCQVQGFLVEIAGWMPYTVAGTYPVQTGARGHSKPFVLIPFRDLTLFKQVTHV